MENVGVFIADGVHLYRIVDRWLGDDESAPMILLENCEDQSFKWFALKDVIVMERIYPDATN